MPRYGQEGTDKTPVTVTNGTNSFALKAVVSDEAKAAAEELPLVISGNTAQYGGGVGSNGGVTIGVENVTITPADITVYMGGEQGYDGVIDGGGVVSSDSLPVPGFLVTLPEALSGVPLDELRLVYEHDGVTRSWTLSKYGPGEHSVCRIDPAEGEGGTPIRMKFTNAEGETVTDEEFDLRSYIN